MNKENKKKVEESVIEGKETEMELSADDAENVEDTEAVSEEINDAPEKVEDVELEESDAEEIAEAEPETEEEVLDAEDAEESMDDTDVIVITEDLLDAEDAEVCEEEEGKKDVKKILLTILAFALGVIIVAYLSLSVYFRNHFYFNTTINNVDQSMKTVEQVEAYMTEQVEGYSLTLMKSDGTTEVISGDLIDMEYEKGEELQQILAEQNAFLWPVSIWEKPVVEAEIGVSFNQKALVQAVDKLDCMQKDNQVEPLSAKPEFDGNEFVVKEETIGSTIIEDTLNEKIVHCLNGFIPELDLAAEGCYEKPEYTQDSEEVLAACDKMNDYLQGTITYKVDSNEEKIDKAQIAEWLSTNSKMKVKIKTSAIEEYVAELAEKYNTYQTTRTFTSGNGNKVKVSGGSYGWIIDQEKECQTILSNIKGGKAVERELKYTKEAASHNKVDWGDTYVEVDLTNQRVYLFMDGKVVLDKPCVTGNVTKGWITPQGVYSIAYCTTNVTLRGPKDKDGEYEWESPVDFWMPFNGSIGLHDASWQHAFGDPRGYTYSGSRGCVNLQYDTAKTIYNNVSAGTPVVVHY